MFPDTIANRNACQRGRDDVEYRCDDDDRITPAQRPRDVVAAVQA